MVEWIEVIILIIKEMALGEERGERNRHNGGYRQDGISF